MQQLGQPMCEVKENKVGPELTKCLFNGRACEVHGGHEERVQGERNVGRGFGAGRKAVDMWDVDWDEGNEMRVEIKSLQLLLYFGW